MDSYVNRLDAATGLVTGLAISTGLWVIIGMAFTLAF